MKRGRGAKLWWIVLLGLLLGGASMWGALPQVEVITKLSSGGEDSVP